MGLIKYILNSDSRRSLRKIGAMVDEIMAMSPTYEKMSDEELRHQTQLFKERLKNGETLDDILREAFAVVREASTEF